MDTPQQHRFNKRKQPPSKPEHEKSLRQAEAERADERTEFLCPIALADLRSVDFEGEGSSETYYLWGGDLVLHKFGKVALCVRNLRPDPQQLAAFRSGARSPDQEFMREYLVDDDSFAGARVVLFQSQGPLERIGVPPSGCNSEHPSMVSWRHRLFTIPSLDASTPEQYWSIVGGPCTYNVTGWTKVMAFAVTPATREQYDFHQVYTALAKAQRAKEKARAPDSV